MTEKKDVYSIFPHPSLPCIVMKWAGHASTQEFKKGTEDMLELLRERGYNYVIADAKQMEMINMESQQWLVENFFPRAIDSGFKACAIVNSDSYLNRMSMENIIQDLDFKLLDIGFFDQISTAEEWIKSKLEDKPKFYLNYMEEICAVYVAWQGVTQGKDFLEGCDAMLQSLIETKSSNAIIDLEFLEYAVGEEEHLYIKNDFLPRAINAGLKSCAFINPGAFNSFSIIEILIHLPKGTINFDFFKNIEEAKVWLQN